MAVGGPAPSQKDFPVLKQSLSLLQRHYSEQNADLESMNVRAGVALTAVAGLIGIALFQLRVGVIQDFEHLDHWWPTALAGALLGFLALFLSEWHFIRSVRLRSAKSPYNLEELATQPDPNYRNEVLFYSRQLEYHRLAITALQRLTEEKRRHVNCGLTLAMCGFILLALLKVAGLVIGIVTTHG